MQQKLNHTSLPILAIGALGETVSIRPPQPAAGLAPAASDEALLSSIAELHEELDVHIETLCMAPSASLDFNLLLEVLIWAQEAYKVW